MIIRTILLIILLFSFNANFIFAQKVQIGEKIENYKYANNYTSDIEYLKDKEGDIYLISFSGGLLFKKSFTIQRFDGKSLKLKTQKEIKKPGRGMHTLNKATLVGDKIALRINASSIKKNGHTIIYYQEIDIATLSLVKTTEGEYYKKGLPDYGKSMAFYKNENETWYDSSLRKNVFIIPSLKKKYSRFKIIQKNINKIEYENFIDLPAMNYGMKITCLFLDEKTGDIYSIIQANSDDNKTQQLNYLISYKKDKNSLTYSKIENGDNRITVNTIRRDEKANKIKVIGFYAEKGNTKEDKDILKGLYAFYVDDCKNIKIMPSKDIDNKSIDLETFKVKASYLLSDGGTVYVNEKMIDIKESYLDYNHNDYNNTNKASSYLRYFINWGDIITYKIDKEGNLSWAKHISKNQYLSSGDAMFGSIATAFNNDKLYIYTTSSTDYEEGKTILKEGIADAKLIEFTLSTDDGNLLEKKLLNGKKVGDMNISIITYFGEQINDNELIIPCWNGNKHLLLRIYLDK